MMPFEVKKIRETLADLLNWNAKRIEFLAFFIIALIKVRTVNLAEIARAFPGRAAASSKFRRIQRFPAGFKLPFDDIARLAAAGLPQGRWIQALDRTDWQFGKTVINLLVLGAVCHGTAVPLLWMPLNKKGNSDTAERIELLERFLTLFGRARIEYVTADREFIGGEWFQWLIAEGIGFCIRIRKNTLLTGADGETSPITREFARVPAGTKKRMQNVTIWGCLVNAEGMRLKNGEYLIVISDKTSGIINSYKARWNIETMFGCLKSRGFRFEDTHLSDPERISRLLALLALAFLWAVQTGAWLIIRGKTAPFKKTLNRPLKSIFRHGLDRLRELLLNPIEKLQEFMQLPEFLSCT